VVFIVIKLDVKICIQVIKMYIVVLNFKSGGDGGIFVFPAQSETFAEKTEGGRKRSSCSSVD
jgi:hypothetical protein